MATEFKKKPLYMVIGTKQFNTKTVTREELLNLILYWKDQAKTCETRMLADVSYIIGLLFQVGELKGFELFTDQELTRTWKPDYVD